MLFSITPRKFFALPVPPIFQSVLKNIARTGSVNLVFTIVALGIVDKSGRRGLMLFGSAALAVIYTAMGAFYFTGIKKDSCVVITGAWLPLVVTQCPWLR